MAHTKQRLRPETKQRLLQENDGTKHHHTVKISVSGTNVLKYFSNAEQKQIFLKELSALIGGGVSLHD
jgi:D-hexose-6-phosphate mutarotase